MEAAALKIRHTGDSMVLSTGNAVANAVKTRYDILAMYEKLQDCERVFMENS